MPDWSKPYVGWAVGTDWPEADESGLFRLADACAATAQRVGARQGPAVAARPGDDWDGEALKEFLEHVRSTSGSRMTELVDRLVRAAIEFNELGVQVEYTKRMIEVSVWLLIFQICWLLAAAMGPWGGVSLALIGPRVQLTRLAIAQLGKRLLINVGTFGALLGGLDLAVQVSQSRRDHLDQEQIAMSVGTGALMGGFLTAFTGFFPSRSIWGLMGRSGLASGATTLTQQLAAGQPVDWELVLKGVTSGVVGGADAHWASWNPSWRTAGTDGLGPAAGGHTATPDPVLPDGGPHPGPPHTLPERGVRPDVLAGAASSAAQSADPLTPAATGLPESAGIRPDGHGASHPATETAASQSLAETPYAVTEESPGGPFEVLPDTGLPGDGYAGPGLWGVYGAAGVMIRSTDADGSPRYLVAQRGPEAGSDVGKWQLPGGALNSRESAPQAAARELREGLGVSNDYLGKLRLTGTHLVAEPNGWAHANLAVEGDSFSPRVDGGKTAAARWVTREELAHMADTGQLHPALAGSLGDVLSLFDDAPAPAIPRMEGYTRIGGQEGGTAGGRFVDPSGKEWYVKASQTDVHAKNEVLANQLYREAGVPVPVVELIDLAGTFGDRRLGVRSGIIEGARDLAAHVNDFSYLKNLYDDFAVDAFLSNWDTVGLYFDNVLKTADGLVRIDGGGSLLYHAAGEPKGDLFTGFVGEIDSLRDPYVNPEAAKVFRYVTEADIRAGVRKIETISEHRISQLVDRLDFPPQEAGILTSTLKARRADLISRFGDHAPSPLDADGSPMAPAWPASGESAQPPLADSNIYSIELGDHVLLDAPFDLDAPFELEAPFDALQVSTSYGDEVWGDVLENLPGEQRDAIDLYTFSSWKPMNGLLRDSRYFEFSDVPPHLRAERKAATLRRIELLDAATRHQPVPETIDVFRSMALREGLFTVPVEELQGTVQRDPAFMSASIGAGPLWPELDVQLHLRVLEGTPAIYVEPISTAGEHELLIGRGRSWFVEDVVLRDGAWHVYGWILPDRAGP
ncbi:ADP-ribosyltransferase [Nonomuraea cavernae]|uniref:ADP-ribosyltransferase n=1 Tax=Nonomuraea cavernae TaxID=2045107 RepID=UPI003409680C